MGSQEHNMVVLGQIVKHIPKKLIEKLKNKHKIQTRSFSATSHVIAMIFAQLSHALSLNDICDCLRFHKGYLAQIRDSVPPSRNGLAHANATRDAELAEDLFWAVLGDIKEKHPQFISGGRHYPGLPWRFRRAIHVVDSTTIQLIAKCMNWAKHREQKAAAKMHLDLDLKSFLPNFAIVKRAKDSDPKMAWALCEPIRAGEIVVFDKAYVDFAHLHHLHHRGVIWVTRAKDNMCFNIVGQQLSEEEIQQSRHMYEAGIFVGQQPIVLSDCRIKLAKETSSEKYPDEFRMITAWSCRTANHVLCNLSRISSNGRPVPFANCTSHDGESRCFSRKSSRHFSWLISSEPARTPLNGRYGLLCSRICCCVSLPGLADGKDRSEGSSPS